MSADIIAHGAVVVDLTLTATKTMGMVCSNKMQTTGHDFCCPEYHLQVRSGFPRGRYGPIIDRPNPETRRLFCPAFVIDGCVWPEHKSRSFRLCTKGVDVFGCPEALTASRVPRTLPVYSRNYY